MGTNISAALASLPVSLNMHTAGIWDALVFCYILKKKMAQLSKQKGCEKYPDTPACSGFWICIHVCYKKYCIKILLLEFQSARVFCSFLCLSISENLSLIQMSGAFFNCLNKIHVDCVCLLLGCRRWIMLMLTVKYQNTKCSTIKCERNGAEIENQKNEWYRLKILSANITGIKPEFPYGKQTKNLAILQIILYIRFK